MYDLSELLRRLEMAEKDVSELRIKVDELKSIDLQSDELQTKNIKLKHRLQVLNNALEEERKIYKKLKKSDNISDSSGQKNIYCDFIENSCGIQQLLTHTITAAWKIAFPQISDYGNVILPSTRSIFGDFQCNSAMSICRLLKESGISLSPMQIAQKVYDNIPESEIIEKVEIAKPGYINIWLSKSFCIERIKKIIIGGVTPPLLKEKKTVLIDFSSPNIAKEMHVGHLRSTILGDSISRLIEFLGYDVIRINHVGDWGTQFGMLIAHLEDKYPNYISETPSISEFQAFYKESKKRFDEDEVFKKRAYECVVKLQSHDPNYIEAWKLICNVSRSENQKIYDKLDINIVERGESFYQKLMEDLVQELDKKGVLEEDEGRKVLFPLEKGLIPMTLIKSDGGFTYDTSDLAALRYRIEVDKASWIIVVTDAGQATHFKVLWSCGELLGILDRKKVRVDHVIFGVVLGEDKKKFKTRSGDTVRLNDLLEEGVRRAEDKLKEKNRHTVLTAEELQRAKEAIAYGCIKYADLSLNRISDYVFSFDKMLEDKGNTAVYLLYALTRIRSIARNAGVSEEQLLEAAQTDQVKLDHEKELRLAKVLLQFNDVLMKIAQDLSPHHLCNYLYEVATTYSEFYDSCYCIEKNQSGVVEKIHMSRLLLCEATARIMEKSFSILGISTVSKM